MRRRCSHSSRSRFICEPFAHHATKENLGPLEVLDTVRLAVVVSEVELRDIAVKVIVGAVLIDALHSALEDREEPFNRVRMNVRTIVGDILALFVVNHAMLGKGASNQLVTVVLVRHELGFAREVSQHDWAKGRRFHVVYDEAASLSAAAIHQRKNLALVVEAAPSFLSLRLLAVIVADVGFVYLHCTTIRAERDHVAFTHRLADAVRHEPSSFDRDTQGALELIRADALLAGSDQEDGLEPVPHGDVRGLENGAHLDGERLAAGVTLVDADPGRLALELPAFAHDAALRADTPVSPDALLYELVGGFFIVEVWGGKYRGHCFFCTFSVQLSWVERRGIEPPALRMESPVPSPDPPHLLLEAPYSVATGRGLRLSDSHYRNPSGAENFIKTFKGTLKHAALTRADIMSAVESVATPPGTGQGGGLRQEAPMQPMPMISNSPATPPAAITKSFKQDVYHFSDGGQVILQWPEGMSKESFEEFKDWIALEMRKICRAVSSGGEGSSQ